jgi:hypothetical protein
MPPAFAHCCSGEGSEPGCEIIAQPARVDSTHSRASPVAARIVHCLCSLIVEGIAGVEISVAWEGRELK